MNHHFYEETQLCTQILLFLLCLSIVLLILYKLQVKLSSINLTSYKPIFIEEVISEEFLTEKQNKILRKRRLNTPYVLLSGVNPDGRVHTHSDRQHSNQKQSQIIKTHQYDRQHTIGQLVHSLINFPDAIFTKKII